MENKCYLDIAKEEDKQHLYRWFSDKEFLATYDYIPPVPMSEEAVNKMMADYCEKNNSIVFIIRNAEGKAIGLAGYFNIIKENLVATLFIGLGDKEDRGKGYGKESLKLLLKYGFNDLRLHRIQLNVLPFNPAGIRLYESAGFVKEGELKEFVLRDGKRLNLHMYGLLSDQYTDK